MTSQSATLLGPEREAAVSEALATASRHWREAFILDPALVPVSVIHASYYAMFHLEPVRELNLLCLLGFK
jgi:hypothetical protein